MYESGQVMMCGGGGAGERGLDKISCFVFWFCVVVFFLPTVDEQDHLSRPMC